jgi:hypothetical protein
LVPENVARAARAGTHAGCGLDHGADDFRVLPHAEIIVGAPDDDVTPPLRGVPDRTRKPTRNALELGEHAVAPLIPQTGDRVSKKVVIVHQPFLARKLVEHGKSGLCLGSGKPALIGGLRR